MSRLKFKDAFRAALGSYETLEIPADEVWKVRNEHVSSKINIGENEGVIRQLSNAIIVGGVKLKNPDISNKSLSILKFKVVEDYV